MAGEEGAQGVGAMGWERVLVKQGQDMETVLGSWSQHVKEGSKGGRERRGLGGGASCQHAQKEILEGWGLEAVITGAVLSCPSPIPVEAALSALCWPRDVPTTPLWPLPFFPFIFIYLLTFMKFPFHPNPIAHVVLTIPPTPAIQLSVQLSVCHKENKNGKQQHLCVVYGEEWLGAQGAGCAGTGAFQPSLGQ